jgi:hypothetical protein
MMGVNWIPIKLKELAFRSRQPGGGDSGAFLLVAADVNHVIAEFLSDLIDGIEHAGPFLALGEKRELELAFVDKV